MTLASPVALVTGAGRRVGRAIAIALGRTGMRIAVHYHTSRRPARETADVLQQQGIDAEPFQADLTQPGAPAGLIAATVAHFGALDVLVNSAAGMERTPFGEITRERWDAIFALNLRAPFLLAQAAAPHLRAREGAIVNIADLGAYETWPDYIPHGVSKSALIQLTRALARVLAPTIRVNAVAPGAVLLPEDSPADTAERLARSTPLQRLGTPEDVADAVVFLARARYITGETVVVDGGRRVRY